MRRLAWFTFVVLATLTAVLLLWEFRIAVVLFVLSLALAAALKPPIERLGQRGLSHGLAVVITYGISVGLIVALIVLFGGRFITELQELANDLARSYEHIKAAWPQGTPFQQLVAQQLTNPGDLYDDITGQNGIGLLQTLLGVTLGSADIIGQFIIVLVLSIYWNADQEHFKRLWLSVLPLNVRIPIREIWQNIEKGLGAYLRSESIQSLLAVLLLSGSFYLIGLRYPLVLGIAGAIGWLIPWVGVIIALVPATVVGLSLSPSIGISAALITVAILSVLEFVVEPRLFSRQRFSSLLVVIVMLILADSFGLIGIVLAPPIAAVLQIVAGEFLHTTVSTLIFQPVMVMPATVLRERLASIQTQLSLQTSPPTPEIANLFQRLGQLIKRAEQEEQL